MTSTGYVVIYDRAHLLAHPTGRIGLHIVVLYEKIGPGAHPCHWCRKLVIWLPSQAGRKNRLVPDHVDGNPQNNAPENLVPSCSGCNIRRGKADTIQPGEPFLIRSGKRVRAERRICHECGSPFLHRIAARNPGLFCSKTCSNRVTARNR